MLSLGVVGLCIITECISRNISRDEFLNVWGGVPLAVSGDLVRRALSEYPNASQVERFIEYLHDLNGTFNYTHITAAIQPSSFAESSSSEPQYKEPAGNPHCDSGGDSGPKRVKKVEPPVNPNPLGISPIPTFDMGQLTEDILNRASGPAAAQQGMTGLIAMTGMMMIKDMVQTGVATGVAVAPPMIPPPVWNLRPLPCLPMVTGGNCFGAVWYPITAADSIQADSTDSLMTGIRKSFRTLFQQKAGYQPDSVYQACFKAFMSLMCSELFPMCTNPQGQEEMIPFLGRVPTCFTACIAVIASCPGFTFDDIKGPCSEVSIMPICTQAIYFRDDLMRDQEMEEDLAAKLNSKCADYNPELDAGEDPLLYETEPPQKLFHSYHEMHEMFR
jgi:hypothetical protein